MPAVKMVPIKDDEGNVVARYFEPSSSFTISVTKNRQSMFRPDGRMVNVNKKLQARGHYDDRHGFTVSPPEPVVATVTTAHAPAPAPTASKEKVK